MPTTEGLLLSLEEIFYVKLLHQCLMKVGKAVHSEPRRHLININIS